ncbi:unnamed protein product, partial [Colletotrichum noveboracense]
PDLDLGELLKYLKRKRHLAKLYGQGTTNFKASKHEIKKSIINVPRDAIQLGFQHLDGAKVYGNEVEMGLAIKTSNIPRQNLFDVTKLWDLKNPKAAF